MPLLRLRPRRPFVATTRQLLPQHRRPSRASAPLRPKAAQTRAALLFLHSKLTSASRRPRRYSAFAAHGRGEALMPPKVYLPLVRYDGDFRAMPAFLDGAAGVKWVNAHPKASQPMVARSSAVPG